jgi:hypothetical protein
MAVFWDVVPCSLVDADRRFRGAYCLDQGDYRLSKKSGVIDNSILNYCVVLLVEILNMLHVCN